MWLLSCATSSELQFYKEISPFSPDLFVAPTEERTLIADRRIVILNENNQQIHSYTKLHAKHTPHPKKATDKALHRVLPVMENQKVI